MEPPFIQKDFQNTKILYLFYEVQGIIREWILLENLSNSICPECFSMYQISSVICQSVFYCEWKRKSICNIDYNINVKTKNTLHNQSILSQCPSCLSVGLWIFFYNNFLYYSTLHFIKWFIKIKEIRNLK